MMPASLASGWFLPLLAQLRDTHPWLDPWVHTSDQAEVPEEAEIVRRIFREFASGKSPKAIAVGLNRDGIPGPLDRAWGDSSIRG